MTKYLSALKRARRVAVLATLTCAATAAAAGLWHANAVRRDDKANSRRAFLARVREGVGREAQLARPGDSPGQVRAAVNSVSSFIDKRSGVRLGAATLDRLATMESAVQGGSARRLTADDTAGAINATLLERFSRLSDQEIAYADDVLRGLKFDDMPAGYARDLRLPDGWVFIMRKPEETVAWFKASRDQINTPAGEVLTGLVRVQVGKRVQGRAKYLSEAVPEQFGSMWDVANDRAGEGITPLQAILVAYSLVSDDALSDGEAATSKRMGDIQWSMTKSLGKPFPPAAKYRPYGVNGYLFSSPLDLMFNDATVNRLLDRLAERSVL